jgi:poly(A) polymerase
MWKMINEVTKLLPEWFNHPDVKAFVALCDTHHIPIRFVGGCVRDTIMQRTVGDFDVATSVLPEDIIERCGKQARIIPTGLAHGTVTIIINNTAFEVTTLRNDKHCDGRHAEVSFTDDWKADALRRDFTMNGIMLAPDGTLYDEVGGITDAKAGKVRFIGVAHQRVEEDYLRLLRLLRFHAYYGATPLDAEAVQVCYDYAKGLSHLSAERIAQEMLKLLAAPAPNDSVTLMQESGMWRVITNNAQFDITALKRLIAYEQRSTLAPQVLVRLIALARSDALHTAKHWKLSNKQQHFIAVVQKISPFQTIKDVDYALYCYGREATEAASLLQDATSDTAWLKHASKAAILNFTVTGSDLLAEGFAAGKGLGDELKRREKAWIEENFGNKI